MRSRRARTLVALLALGAPLAACSEAPETKSSGYEPSKLSEVAGSDEIQQVSFTAEGAERIGLRTAPVRSAGDRTTVPYAAVLYGADGETYVYTNPKPLTFLRLEVTVDDVRGDAALLREGPAVGTKVVTVGAAQVYGAETGTGH